MAKISQGQITKINAEACKVESIIGLIGITAALVDSGCKPETIDAALIAIMSLTIQADNQLKKLLHALPSDNGHE